MSTTGNASDFGDLVVGRQIGAGAASSTRGLMAGGQNPGPNTNAIDTVEIATTGNATDFGDLSVSRRGPGGCSDCIRAVFVAGSTPSEQNTMDYVQFSALGSAIDFGDSNDTGFSSGTSNGHGGL